MDKIFEEQLEKAGKFHGDICGGIVIGTKLAIYALEKMGMELNKKK
jgi:formylmethanofuran dehydrogenase subunit E